jgi:PST family polysaccharide transporter
MMGTTVALRVVSIISTIYLARLLNPVDFGVMALGYLVLLTVDLLSTLGLPAAVIQRQLDRERSAFQAFVVVMATSLVLGVLIIAGGGLISDLLRNDMVRELMPWMALILVLTAAARIPEALLEKDMTFNRLSLIMILSEVAYIPVALILAALGFGVWSLVYASVGRAAVALLLSWSLCPGRDWYSPRAWDAGLMRTLLGFGLKSAASRVVYFFYSNVDNFIVGRELGTLALGFYSKAFDFTSKTVDNLNKTIGVVLFPSYSRIQHDPARLSGAYLKSLRMISSVTVPLSMGIFLTAPDLVPVVLGTKWVPIVPILRILAFMSLVKPLSSTTSAVFNALGKPDFNFRAGIVVTVVMLVLIVLLLGYGPEGVAFAVFVSHVAGFAFNIYQIHTVLPATASKMLPAAFPAAVSTAVMMLAMHYSRPLLGRFFGLDPSAMGLAVIIAFGVVVYVAALWMVQRKLLLEVLTLMFHRERSQQV